jgi:hypothetical protein
MLLLGCVGVLMGRIRKTKKSATTNLLLISVANGNIATFVEKKKKEHVIIISHTQK